MRVAFIGVGFVPHHVGKREWIFLEIDSFGGGNT